MEEKLFWIGVLMGGHLFLSHHFFVPVYQPCSRISVQISRPIRGGFDNVNYVGSAGNDILFCVSVVP